MNLAQFAYGVAYDATATTPKEVCTWCYGKDHILMMAAHSLTSGIHMEH
jgi:hypothetical protein